MNQQIQQTIVGLHDKLANALALGAAVVLVFCVVLGAAYVLTR